MTVCPCCGSRLACEMSEGCAACGARAVGPPLPPPEHQLPSYLYALFAAASAALLLIIFASVFAATLAARESFSLAPAVMLYAAEQTAWRLKWTLLPSAALAAIATARLLARMRREPRMFIGQSVARAGLAASFAVALTLALLISVTLPERLRRRELARRAADNAVLYATDRALHEYRVLYGSYPADPSDLRRLPRTDCSIEEVIARLEQGDYAPRAEIASLGRGRTRGRRARTSKTTDDVRGSGLTLTNYELVLPGRDGSLGTPDDLRIRDGLILDSISKPVQTTPTPLKKI